MQRIYESKYYTIDYSVAKNIFEFRFKHTLAMTWADFRAELIKQTELAFQYQPAYFFFDTKNFHFLITPEMQGWIDDNIFTKFIEAGVKKYAYLNSTEIIAQISIENTMDERIASIGFSTKYFNDETEAKKWLLE